MTTKASPAMAHNPLKDEELLTDTFYRKGKAEAKEDGGKKKKPTHYKICCISLYNEDIERLDDMVKTLKERGYTKANKSQIIRYALANVDLDEMPKHI